MSNLVSRIFSNNIFKNILVMASGAAGGQIVALIFMPLLTRIYGPEAFGLYGAFVALLAVLMPLSVLSFSMAIVLPKEKEEACDLVVLSAFVGVFIFILLLAIFGLCGELVLNALNIDLQYSILMLLPFALLFYGIYQIFNYWLIREMDFKLISSMVLLNSVIGNGVKFGFSFLNPVGSFLVLALVFQYLLHALMLSRKVVDSWSLGASYKFNIHRIRAVAIKYRDYPFFRTPQLFLNSLSFSIPVVLISVFFASAEVGYFTLAWTVVSAPALLIGQAIGSVFYPEITKRIQQGLKVDKLILKVFIVLFLVSFLPFLILYIYGDTIFLILFGNEWVVAGEYARYMSLAVLLGLVHRPCEAYLQAANRSKIYMIFEVVSIGSLVLVMYLANYHSGTAMSVIQAFVVVKAVYYVSIIFYTYYTSRYGFLLLRV